METRLKFAPPRAELEKRPDGTMLLRSPQKLGDCPRCVTEWLVHWSEKAPDRTFLQERKVRRIGAIASGQLINARRST